MGLFLGLPMPTWLQAATGLGILACIVAVLLTQVPKVWEMLARIPFLRKSALAALNSGQTFSLRWLPDTFGISLVFWLATGVAFLFLVFAVNPATPLNALQGASLFALAWCVGFVIVFLPAGFGAREAVLSFLLTGIMPLPEAISVALLARFWWMAAEAVYLVIFLIWLPSRGAKAAPEPTVKNKPNYSGDKC